MFKPESARSLSITAIAMIMALIATGCAESTREGGGGDPNESQPLVFAGAGDPRSVDPVLANDGETFRVTRQIYDTLLTHEPGGTKIVGGLAESWEQSDDGTEWTFKLRDGVKFHDGEALDAEAVCANFNRWYNFTGNYQNSNQTYYWQKTFGGFAENEDKDTPEANFSSCSAPEELTAVIKVEEPSANYPGAFSLASFGIMSPKVIEKVTDEKVTGDPGSPVLPDYSQEAGTVAGTGPYRLVDWDHDAQEVTLERFDDYWGEKAKVKTLIVKTISEEAARKQALEAGDIHGYDLVAPADVEPLKQAGFRVPVRDVFNILYLAYQQETSEELADRKVRQAIAHAVDRQRIVDTILPEGGKVARQFIPETVEGWSPDVTTYDFDPEKAKSLLKEAGQADLEIDMCFPTEVTRPYMPAPQDIFDIIKADLEAVGITVTANSMPWGDYIPYTDSGGCSLYLLGWTGDFNEAFNFLGTWFDGYDSGWGFRNDELFALMDEVSSVPDQERRTKLYQEVNREIMDYLPGLPISHSPPSIAFAPNVNPPAVSPLTQENFSEASFK
ncbi:ABC transporter substrate-binding protein [Nocardiopsis gilva]